MKMINFKIQFLISALILFSIYDGVFGEFRTYLYYIGFISYLNNIVIFCNYYCYFKYKYDIVVCYFFQYSNYGYNVSVDSCKYSVQMMRTTHSQNSQSVFVNIFKYNLSLHDTTASCLVYVNCNKFIVILPKAFE